jgi:hypothetical protein
MGSLTPILGTLTQTVGAVSAFANSVDTLTGGGRRDVRAEQNLAMQNLQQSQALSAQQAREKANRDRAQIAEQGKQSEEARRNALRRAIAKQNARVGASGVSRTGSNEAILLGLVNDSADTAQNNKALDQLRYNTIDSGLNNLRSSNILEKTQLAERQRLDRAIGRF